MSLEYLRIGKIASCASNNTGEYDNAVAYQLFHALELFIKYAILLKDEKKEEILIHDLSKLTSMYEELYVEEIFKIDNLFNFSSYLPSKQNIDEEKLVKEHLKQFKLRIMDQHLRYPPDSKTGGYSFKFDSSIFKEFEQKFEYIFTEIHKKS